MNWDLIPESFFDFIARLVPGSLFLVGAFAVYVGPQTLAEMPASKLPDADLASLLLLGLLAYFAAIVLKEIWEFGAWIGTRIVSRTAGSVGPSDDFLRIRSRMPEEVTWLLKLQAEKNICEVLVPGLGILFLGNLWLIAAPPSEHSTERIALEYISSGDSTERIALGLVLLISTAAFWRWRKSLERFYCEGLAIVKRLSEEPKPVQRDRLVLSSDRTKIIRRRRRNP
jgi:hypothetical protein